tara:strand:+ start:65 stop:826 length:762 start_codon:yes stop_codon:yes gene_type:complete
MTEDRMNWLMVENGGVAGFYLASLNRRAPNKAAWMREMLNRFEPTKPLLKQEQQVSADFFLDKHHQLDAFEGDDENFARWSYAVFANWWSNKRRNNQHRYTRSVMINTSWDNNPVVREKINNNNTEDDIMKMLELKKVWRLLPLFDEREHFIFEWMLGITKPIYDVNGDCLNYPPRYIKSKKKWMTGKAETLRQHKIVLRRKIRNFVENYSTELEDAIAVEWNLENEKAELDILEKMKKDEWIKNRNNNKEKK